jgi:acid stress-induced BolA-like protein IbaG/YrbA
MSRASTDFKKRVEKVFEEAFPEAVVDVSSGYGGNVHVVLVSKRFNRMSEEDKQALAWDVARGQLAADELLRVSIIFAYGPRELKAVG